MWPSAVDGSAVFLIMFGALLAGFASGFAGFGAGLVASSVWLHAMPAPMVPPLVLLISLVSQATAMGLSNRKFETAVATPMIVGGVVGLPIGILMLAGARPDTLRLLVGVLLVIFALSQFGWMSTLSVGKWGGRKADGLVGLTGGILGGFAGVPGPVPLIWLRLRGGTRQEQRAIFFPFSIATLSLGSLAMALSGHLDRSVMWLGFICVPALLLGTWFGVRFYLGVSEETFKRVLTLFLLVSGIALVVQSG